MGRPINHHYIGDGSIVNYTVLRPLVQLRGVLAPAWMLRQTGSNKFYCRQISTGYTGVCEFVNAIVQNNQMILRYRNIDSTIRDFSGGSLPWTLHSAYLVYDTKNYVYIYDNSSEP